jgi:hypothetical protein
MINCIAPQRLEPLTDDLQSHTVLSYRSRSLKLERTHFSEAEWTNYVQHPVAAPSSLSLDKVRLQKKGPLADEAEKYLEDDLPVPLSGGFFCSHAIGLQFASEPLAC